VPELEIVTVSPETALPLMSLAVNVAVDVEYPSAVTDAGLSDKLTVAGNTATPAGPFAPVMKLWLGPVPSRFARPIVPAPLLAQ
jgi:hypothetical protein